MRHTRGFSLVELLVSIAIIALLIALAVPALRRARLAGQQAACTSNLRQMGVALNAYAVENEDYASAGVERDIFTNQFYVWVARYRTYASNSYEIFNCPAAVAVARWQYRADTSGRFTPRRPTAYGYLDGELPLIRGGDNYPIGSPEAYFSYGYNQQGVFGSARAWAYQPGPRDLGIVTLGLGWLDHSFAPPNTILWPNWDGQRLSSLVMPDQFIAFADSSPEGRCDAEITPWNQSVQGYDSIVSTRHGGGKPDMTYEASRNPTGGRPRIYTESRTIAGGPVVAFGDGHADFQLFRDVAPFDKAPTADNVRVIRRWNRDFEPHAETWLW